jgi:hypothetical protein
MNRREAVQYISLLLGGTIAGGTAFLTGCKTTPSNTSAAEFSADDVAYLDEIADTILPTTKTPGAKAAQVGQFMTVMVRDCYDDDHQKTFREGMNKLNDESKKQFGNNFMDANPQQRHDLLVRLDKEQKDYMAKKQEKDQPHYFRLMKELTLLGYFTSKIGCTQARRYAAVPGRYDGCVPYKKGDKAWV